VARIGSRGFTYRVCFPSLPAPSFSPRKNAALGERPQGIDSGSEREQARQKEKERERERERNCSLKQTRLTSHASTNGSSITGSRGEVGGGKGSSAGEGRRYIRQSREILRRNANIVPQFVRRSRLPGRDSLARVGAGIKYAPAMRNDSSATRPNDRVWIDMTRTNAYLK